MSRRFNRTAFGHANFSSIRSTLDTLLIRMCRANVPPSITSTELISMFAPPDVQHILTEAPKVCAIGKYWRDSDVSYPFEHKGAKFVVTFEVTGADRPLLPKDPVLQPNVDLTIVEAVKEWGFERMDIGWRFGKLGQALNKLDDICNSPRQVRYLWPSIIALCRLAKLDELIEKMEGRAPANIPSIPGPLRLALQEGAGLIAAASLLENDNTVHDDRGFCGLSVGTADKNYRDDGFGSYSQK